MQSGLESACLNQGMQVFQKRKALYRPNRAHVSRARICLFYEPPGWWPLAYADRGETTLWDRTGHVIFYKHAIG